MWVVGRVCCDSDGHLNEKSLVLEGTLKYSGGSRVKLDVSRMAEFSLFPGQVVAVHAVNPTGNNLVALAIIGHLPQVFRSPCEGNSTFLIFCLPWPPAKLNIEWAAAGTTKDWSFLAINHFLALISFTRLNQKIQNSCSLWSIHDCG